MYTYLKKNKNFGTYVKAWMKFYLYQKCLVKKKQLVIIY